MGNVNNYDIHVNNVFVQKVRINLDHIQVLRGEQIITRDIYRTSFPNGVLK